MSDAMVKLLAGVVMCAVIAFVHRRGVAVSTALEQRHPDVFNRLGHPRPSYSNPIANARFDRFIFRREYSKLSDPEFIEACNQQRRYNFVVLAVIVATIGLWVLLSIGRHAG